MARVCTVCSHPDRKKIDHQILNNGVITRIAAMYKLTPQALTRHRDDHIGLALARGAEIKAKNHGVDLLESLDDLVMSARTILRKAQTDGHNKTALAAIKEARSSLVAIAQITHSMWSQQQKEEQLLTISPVNEYINASWHRNFKKLPKSEQLTFQGILLKCLNSTGPTYSEEEETQEPTEPEKVAYSAPIEVTEAIIEDISDRPMKRSPLKKPK